MTAELPKGKPGAGALLDTAGELSKGSATAGEPRFTTVNCPVLFATTSLGATIEGGVVTVTLTENDAWVTFPRELVAEQSTVVSPIGKIAPEDGTQTGTRLPSFASSAETPVYLTGAPEEFDAGIVISAGTLMTGTFGEAEISVTC